MLSVFLSQRYTEQPVGGPPIHSKWMRCEPIDDEATNLLDEYAATCRVQSARAFFHCHSVLQSFSVSLTNNVDLCTRVNNHHQRVFLCMKLQEKLTINSLVHASSVDAEHVCGDYNWHVFC